MSKKRKNLRSDWVVLKMRVVSWLVLIVQRVEVRSLTASIVTEGRCIFCPLVTPVCKMALVKVVWNGLVGVL